MSAINSLKKLNIFRLFDASADAMLFVDDQGQVIQANDSALQMLAYTENEIVGLKVEMLMPLAKRAHHQQHRDSFFNNPEKRSMGNGQNLTALTQDGRELPVDIGLSPMEVDGQRFVLVTFHATDKLILTEASLKASEERLRLAKLAAGLGVFDIDLKFNVVLCDERISQIYGFPANETIAYDRFVEAIDFADQSRWQAVFDGAIQSDTNGEYHLEFRVNNLLDKSQRWLFAAGKVFFKGKDAVRILGVVQDVTERKLLAHKLSVQRIDMEALAKQQVAIQTASAIAHEINQPLAAISAYSEVALFALNAENLDKDRLNKSLTGCVEQANRAGSSLHELMEFLHKGELAEEPLNLNEVVQQALAITQDNGYGGFHATLDLEPDLPDIVANRTQLKKVLVNLLRNGIEAAQAEGILTTNIDIKVRTTSEPSMAQVTIQDNGPGLNEEAAKKLFTPFYTTKVTGIGMGLSISRALIEANGGQLWFDPDSVVGATFHLTLPFANNKKGLP
jgi:two-component system, LuxR family, sensor kinase FixL